MKQADRIAGAALLVLAVFVMLQASGLPYWQQESPGPGFLPFWLGALTGVAALALAGRTLRSEVAVGSGATRVFPVSHIRRRLAVLATLALAAALAAKPLGVPLMSGVYMAAFLFYLSPRRRAANAALAVLTPFVIWLLFVRWLKVPLPAGPFRF